MAASKPKWSKTLIAKMKIPKLEECLRELGLSIDCETSRRSEELKNRLKSHLYPESQDQASSSNLSNLEFLKYGAVLKRIPKGSRPSAAKVLTQILENLISKNDNASWQRLFQFGRSCLGATKRGGKKNKSHATIVNKRLEAFTGDAPQIVPQVKKKPSSTIRTRVANKMAAADITGAVRILASNDSVLSPSASVIEMLREKHPQRHQDSENIESNESESTLIGRIDIKRAISSFKPGSSGGPDGLLPQHMKDMTADSLGETAFKLVDTLVEFYNKIVLCGKVPNEICSIFFGANLIALSKSDNGVRPIAMGFTFRRIAGKMLMAKLTHKSKQLFQPHQMGVGTPKGAEAAVHAVRAYVTNPNLTDKVLLKIDFRNAFNQVRRDVILNQVKKHTPEIFNYVYQSYSEKFCLFYGSHSEEACVIDSNEGVQQGDPIGPFLFSLAIRDLMLSCESDLNCWYLDDGTIASSPETVMSDYKKILQCSDTLGLSVNPKKCELYLINPQSDETKNALREFCNLTDGIKLVKKEDLTLLGAPIFPEAIEGALYPKLESLKLMASRLVEIDKHDALFLLRQCFAIPKMTYFFRTGPCFLKSKILEEYDQVIRTALTNILNTQLTEESVWTQCTLPVKDGGLGIRAAQDLALPAFLSSYTASIQTAFSILPEGMREEHNQFFDTGWT